MRAFVEIDHTVNLTCLNAALELKSKWDRACTVQIVAFAQDPIFSTENGDRNRELMNDALSSVDVIGTTPYVETDEKAAKKNIEWAIDCALRLNKHVDFHLDYNLDPEKEALVWHVLTILQDRGWTSRSSKRVMLGHCSRLTLFADDEWARLAAQIHENGLPVSFVGLPTSDIYMANNGQRQHPRGTLQILDLIRQYKLDAVIGVNNVGNAFTPWGLPDPLSLACLGVGVYQAGSQADAELLYECVSTRGRAAIGLETTEGLCVRGGSDLLLVRDRDETGCGVSRPRRNVAEVVWTPPGLVNRDVIVGGRLKVSPFGGEDVYRFW